MPKQIESRPARFPIVHKRQQNQALERCLPLGFVRTSGGIATAYLPVAPPVLKSCQFRSVFRKESAVERNNQHNNL